NCSGTDARESWRAGCTRDPSDASTKGKPMTPIEMKGSRFYAAIFAAAMLGGACASEDVGPVPVVEPQQGHAFLKIVGDKSVFLEYGGAKEIVVKYVNDQD